MQPRWERKQVRQAMTGVLLFTHEQSKLVQAEAKRRISLEAAASTSSDREESINRPELRRIPENDWSRSGVASRFRLSSVLQRILWSATYVMRSASGNGKLRVPDTFQLGVILQFSAF